MEFVYLESRFLFAGSPLEHEMLEWINRDRLDPISAVNRVGTTLNEGLPIGSISEKSKHTLRWNDKLHNAAESWLNWNMLNGKLTHAWGNSNVMTRVLENGFPAISAVENGGITIGVYLFNESDMERIANSIHNLFVSHAGHRIQLFNEDVREVGISIQTGMWNGQLSEMVFVDMAVKNPIQGDFNEDGFVDSLDFNILVSNYAKRNVSFFDGDLNSDNLIDTIDFNIFAEHYGDIDII